MAKRALLAIVFLAAPSLAVVLPQPWAEAGSIEDQQKAKVQSSKTKPLNGLEEKRQKPIGFVPSPGSLRQIRSLNEPTRQRIRQIVESSRWVALRQQIDQLAAANNIPLPRRPQIGPPYGPPPSGPPPKQSQDREEELGSDLLAAMIGADKPESSKSSTRQRKALDVIRRLQTEAHQEWLKVWTAVRPVLSPENLKELQLINEHQQADRYPPP